MPNKFRTLRLLVFLTIFYYAGLHSPRPLSTR